MKKIFIVAFVLSLATPASAIDNMICEGEIGNGYSQHKSGYRTFGKKIVKFSLDCGWYKNYIQGQKNCTSFLEGTRVPGYQVQKTWTFSSNEWPNIQGQYNIGTRYLFFQIKEGKYQQGNVNSLNETQRWFNGYCN